MQRDRDEGGGIKARPSRREGQWVRSLVTVGRCQSSVVAVVQNKQKERRARQDAALHRHAVQRAWRGGHDLFR